MYTFQKSTRKNKKYMVKNNDKWVHFGDTRYEQYEDITPLQIYKDQNHYDIKRRDTYRKRALHIKDRNGNLTCLDKSSPNHWAFRFLWT